MTLQGKHILIGITGSIAAYKAANIVRLLVKNGAEVKVIMTPLAKEFITPLTMATLSKNPILVDFFNPENGDWNSHISLGEWADYYLIAPATANTIAKMACGIADNLLLTTYLSARCPVGVAPAMDLDMYAHSVTRENIAKLKSSGVEIIEPAEGELASGLVGKGRMAEPEDIVAFLERSGEKKNSLLNKKIVITAGATIEAIDPVRYISNHSTGKMGYAIAEELALRGAEVTLISGRTDLECSNSINRVDVTSAHQMYVAAKAAFEVSDCGIMCAAVADYTPKDVSDKKIKKSEGNLTIELERTVDIAKSLGEIKQGRVLVGFALETDNEGVNAMMKLESKNLDFIVMNSLNDSGAGFGVDTNKITIFERNGEVQEYPLMSKRDVAVAIVDRLERYLGGC